jgi:hypothetical protein
VNRLFSVLLGCLLAAFAVLGLAVIADRAAVAQLERETVAAQVWVVTAGHSG